MANTNAPFGFSQWSGQGSSPTYEQVVFPIAYDYATAIYNGDPVMIDATTGNLITLTPGTQQVAGIFIGCRFNAVAYNGQLRYAQYWPGVGQAVAGSVEAFVINDPNAQFLAQIGGSTSVGATQAAVGGNLQVVMGTGSTLTGQSGAYLDITTADLTVATLPFKVYGLVTTPPGVNGTEAGVYNWVRVGFNNVMTKQLTGLA